MFDSRGMIELPRSTTSATSRFVDRFVGTGVWGASIHSWMALLLVILPLSMREGAPVGQMQH